MNPSLSLLVLRCRDIETSKSFYENFGMKFIKEKHGKGAEHFAAELNEFVLELYPLKQGQEIDPSRLGFSFENKPGTLDLLKTNNSGLGLEESNSTTIQDPDGRKIEITWKNKSAV